MRINKKYLVITAVGALSLVVFALLVAPKMNSKKPESVVAQSLEVEPDNKKELPSEITEAPPNRSQEQSAINSESEVIVWEEGMDPLDLLTQEELDLMLGNESKSAANTNTQDLSAPAPKKNKSGSGTKRNKDYAAGIPTLDDASSETTIGSSSNADCYGEHAAACKAGFVAPSIEFAGYHSCSKPGDGTVEIKGLVRLVGGNYKDFAWDTASHNGMGIVSSRNTEAPYVIMWYATATFYSMDSRYSGVIGQAGNSGTAFIDESQLDPSCRF